MSQRDSQRDPHDPDAETQSTDQYAPQETSAASELAALLDADRDGVATDYVDPEERMERAADAEDAPVNWGIVIPLAIIVAAIVGWGLAAPTAFPTSPMLPSPG